MLLITNSQTISIIAKQFRNGRFIVIYFTTLMLPCDNFKRFPCILLKSVMHATNNQFLDKFNDEGRLFSRVFLFTLAFMQLYKELFVRS